MSLSVKAAAEPIRTLLGSSIISTYLPLGTQVVIPNVPVDAFEYPSRIIHIQNLTNQPVFISYQLPGMPIPTNDGSQDHFILNSQTFILLDVASDNALPVGQFFIPEGSIFYVRAQATLPTTGAVWLSSIYGKNAI